MKNFVHGVCQKIRPNLLISQIMTNYYSLRITISMNYFIRF